MRLRIDRATDNFTSVRFSDQSNFDIEPTTPGREGA
jgi:hypothetical protein